MNKEDKTIEQEFKIPIEKLFPKFDDHLKVKNNYRILFSGKFGIGKTYFLNEFFESKKNEYEAFHLFPVNYQIASNEDIIEFLKYDILVELVKKNKDIFKNGNDEDVGMIEYIKKDFNMNFLLKNATSHLIDPIPQIGKILGKPLKTMLEFDEKFQEFKKGDENVIKKFLEKNNTETDCLSQILKNKIKTLKAEKQSVLILDDLERIDPEHIFRMLNIFSAHFDLHNNKLVNKFGFDKIVLVTDYQNIKSIFHHKYGENTDFNGYFDKFFNIEIFQFQNKKIITKAVDQVISRFKIEDEENLKEALGKYGYLRFFLEEILIKSSELSGKEKTNLRQLLKGIAFPLSAFKKGFYGKESMLQFMNIGIKAFISIFGGMDNDFLSVLKKIRVELKPKKENDKDYKEFSESLLQRMYPFDINAENTLRRCFDYSITLNKGKIKSIFEQENAISAEFLFFDLLIEYVEKKYYLQEEGAYI